MERGSISLIGALVGIERDKRKEQEAQPSIGGLRTFILMSLLGAIGGWLADALHARRARERKSWPCGSLGVEASIGSQMADDGPQRQQALERRCGRESPLASRRRGGPRHRRCCRPLDTPPGWKSPIRFLRTATGEQFGVIESKSFEVPGPDVSPASPAMSSQELIEAILSP